MIRKFNNFIDLLTCRGPKFQRVYRTIVGTNNTYYGISKKILSLGGCTQANFIIWTCCCLRLRYTYDLNAIRIVQRYIIIYYYYWPTVWWINIVLFLDAVILNVLLYLIGKFSITISFVILYMYTAEMFPTEIRHSLFGICSMFGRIGSMVAPQTPLLVSNKYTYLCIIGYVAYNRYWRLIVVHNGM